MMFRRRTTDQVYATLQQVQRRITEQGSGTHPIPPAGVRPLSAIAPRPLQTNQNLGTPPANNSPNVRPGSFPGEGDEQPAINLMPAGQAHPRGTLHIPLQLAITIFLLWLGTVIAAAFLGMRMGSKSDPDESRVTAVAEKPTKPVDPETPAPGKRLGDSIFVLKSAMNSTQALKQQFQNEADQLNKLAKQGEAAGWQPYFGVREPENGSLELVFGYANGTNGIERAKFENLVRILALPKDKKGFGYTTAKWIGVD